MYDFFPLGPDRLFFLIGDVAGKGLPASIFMAVSKALYKSNVLRGGTDGPVADEIARVMTAANREISRENTELLFVTVFAGILDLETGELAYCNAGHENPSVLERTGGVRARLAGGDGPPLCVVTDGVTEAHGATGELYGDRRLQLVLQRRVPDASTARDLLDAVRDAVAAFTGPAEAADDVTVLVLRWNGPAHHAGAASPAGHVPRPG